MSLRYYGDPILRKRSEEVTEITPEVKKIIDELIEVARGPRSLGISAPQLGYLLRIFVLCIDEHREDGTTIPGTPRVYINPKLSNPSEDMVVMEEGCMSIPGLYVPVERPRCITIEAMNEHGEWFKEDHEDFPARPRMHENDHLNGVLTIDRLPKRLRNRYDSQLRTIKKKYGP